MGSKLDTTFQDSNGRDSNGRLSYIAQRMRNRWYPYHQQQWQLYVGEVVARLERATIKNQFPEPF